MYEGIHCSLFLTVFLLLLVCVQLLLLQLIIFQNVCQATLYKSILLFYACSTDRQGH